MNPGLGLGVASGASAALAARTCAADVAVALGGSAVRAIGCLHALALASRTSFTEAVFSARAAVTAGALAVSGTARHVAESAQG